VQKWGVGIWGSRIGGRKTGPVNGGLEIPVPESPPKLPRGNVCVSSPKNPFLKRAVLGENGGPVTFRGCAGVGGWGEGGLFWGPFLGGFYCGISKGKVGDFWGSFFGDFVRGFESVFWILWGEKNSWGVVAEFFFGELGIFFVRGFLFAQSQKLRGFFWDGQADFSSCGPARRGHGYPPPYPLQNRRFNREKGVR
jgi:hypothetical protein